MSDLLFGALSLWPSCCCVSIPKPSFSSCGAECQSAGHECARVMRSALWTNNHKLFYLSLAAGLCVPAHQEREHIQPDT